MKRSTVFVELPMAFCFSVLLAFLVSRDILPTLSSFYSFALLLFALMNASFEVEYHATAQFHRRWYRVSSKELLRQKCS